MRVLLAIDGSSDSRTACDLLAQLGWGEDHPITLLSVADEMHLLTDEIDRDLARWREDLMRVEMRAAEVAARLAAKRLEGACPEVDIRIQRGDPAREILAAARELDTDLIVLGNGGKSPVRDWFLGSVARTVLHQASCSVLIGRAAHAGLARVVLAYDGSPEACAALDWAIRLPLCRTQEVRVVSIPEPVPLPAAGPAVILPIEYVSPVESCEEERRNIGVAKAEEAVQRLKECGINATACTGTGSAAVAIVDQARECGANLILVGAHARRGWFPDLLGRTARAIVQKSPCSVLVARSMAGAALAADRAAASSAAAGGSAP